MLIQLITVEPMAHNLTGFNIEDSQWIVKHIAIYYKEKMLTMPDLEVYNRKICDEPETFLVFVTVVKIVT